MYQTSFMEELPAEKECYRVIRVVGAVHAQGETFHHTQVEDYSEDDLSADLHEAIRSANTHSLERQARYWVLAKHLDDMVVYRVSPEHYCPGTV